MRLPPAHRLPTLGLIPLDARPVCYDLPAQLSQLAGITLLMPPKSLLGQLKQPADLKALSEWAETTHVAKAPHHWVLALDTLIYGGLIPSRQGTEPKETLLARWHQWQGWLEHHQINPDAFASILRIPAYNNATEEPDYWENYGTTLHQISVALHRDGMAETSILNSVPPHIWQHFMATRQRNLALHHTFIEALLNQQLASVVWCEDDTGPFGLNRLEAEQLDTLLGKLHLRHCGRRQTGADELASTLLVRQLLAQHPQPIRVATVFTHPETAGQIAKFDGIPFEHIAQQQRQACGANAATQLDEADMVLWMHTPPPAQNATTHPADLTDLPTQGDWCETLTVNPNPELAHAAIQSTLATLLETNIPIIIADCAMANGGDPLLLDAIQHHLTPSQLYGYAGWNTPGNSCGSALALGLSRYWAQQHHTFQAAAFAKALLTRLIDDGLYQNHYRRALSPTQTLTNADAQQLTQAMAEDMTTWAQWCGLPNAHITLTFPCHRRFEIAVAIDA